MYTHRSMRSDEVISYVDYNDSITYEYNIQIKPEFKR